MNVSKLKILNYRLILNDGTAHLLEVKNFRQKDIRRRLEGGGHLRQVDNHVIFQIQKDQPLVAHDTLK